MVMAGVGAGCAAASDTSGSLVCGDSDASLSVSKMLICEGPSSPSSFTLLLPMRTSSSMEGEPTVDFHFCLLALAPGLPPLLSSDADLCVCACVVKL